MDREQKKKLNNILLEAFYDNKSLNYVVKQDKKKDKRLKRLINYSIFMGEEFGKIYYFEKTCAILLYPEKKKVTLKSILWDLKLAVLVIGISNIAKVLRKEKILKSHHPSEEFIHLWYIATKEKGKGNGSKLLNRIVSEHQDKKVYLETSNNRNLNFYKKNGFKIINTIPKSEISYDLYLFSN